MKHVLLLVSSIVLASSMAMAGNPPCQKDCGVPPSQSSHNHATSNANQKQYQSTTSSSKSDSTALAGAYSGSLSGSESNSSAKGGDSDARAYSGDSVSGSASIAGGGKASSISGDSYSGAHSGDSISSGGDGGDGYSTSDNQVTVSSLHEGDRYPEIPVNAGVVFASVCQEGSSATNSKISIALTTDSSFCNRLQLADSYRVMFTYYSQACNSDRSSNLAGLRHRQFLATQVKGAVPLTEADYDDVLETENCENAEEYRLRMAGELEKAQKMLDRTSVTGLIAKWSTQLGIPASVLYVLIAAL